MTRYERDYRAERRRDRQYRDDLRSIATLAANAEREQLTEAEWRAEQDPHGYRSDEYAAYLNNAKP